MFTLLLDLNIVCGQKWIQFEWQNSLSRVYTFDGKIHYHLANLWNRVTTKIFDIFRIITLKQQNFSQSDPVLIRQIKKNCSPIQSWSGQNWLQSWSSPIQSRSVLISVAGTLERLHRIHLRCFLSVLNMIWSPDRDPTGFCTSDPDWTGFWKSSTGSDMHTQSALITAVKCLIRFFFGYEPDWIKYFDRSRTGLWKKTFWTGLGFQKSPICSTLVFMCLIR